MNVLLRRACVALFALVAFAQAPAAQLTRVGDLQASTRPANVPADYLVTPAGYFHAACVVQLDDGEQVLAAGDVRRRDGSVRRVAACSHPNFGRNGERREADGTRPEPDFDGWLAYSYSDYRATPPAKGMEATWTVPSNPVNVTGQTLYYFPGLEAAPNVVTILQPVLGWSSYGNSSWTMANWNCCKSGTVYAGNPIPVSAGDKIHGAMLGSQCTANGVCATWKIRSTDVTTARSTTFTTQAFNQAFNWYFGGVMEVYGIATCDQLPANGRVDFTKVHVEDLSSTRVSPAWLTTFSASAPDCSYAVNTTVDQTHISFSTH